ncbi:MAG: nucleotidyl transferase AbiEii/AbiGii toxin family protein [Prevotellaceae bacterium]|nr:nucleotidyl transferase AbiEii/AbiGii toxin family protein [Prevotellaceae bacterium]
MKKLHEIPELKGLRLVGGTALALYLGHRRSIDLDFFGSIKMDGMSICNILTNAGFDALSERDTTNIHIFKVNNVKVDMVNYSFDWLEPSVEIDGIRMAGLKDIAAMKLEAITNRGTRKDFVDLYFLLQHFTLNQMLNMYLEKYTRGSIFNVIRSLSYFVDAEEVPMPEMLIPVKWENIKTTIRRAVERQVKKSRNSAKKVNDTPCEGDEPVKSQNHSLDN